MAELHVVTALVAKRAELSGELGKLDERRAEIGTHHHISGPYLHSYANEMAWREDNRREANGTQYLLVTAAALGHPVSREWKGYWQRNANHAE